MLKRCLPLRAMRMFVLRAHASAVAACARSHARTMLPRRTHRRAAMFEREPPRSAPRRRRKEAAMSRACRRYVYAYAYACRARQPLRVRCRDALRRHAARLCYTVKTIRAVARCEARAYAQRCARHASRRLPARRVPARLLRHGVTPRQRWRIRTQRDMRAACGAVRGRMRRHSATRKTGAYAALLWRAHAQQFSVRARAPAPLIRKMRVTARACRAQTFAAMRCHAAAAQREDARRRAARAQSRDARRLMHVRAAHAARHARRVVCQQRVAPCAARYLKMLRAARACRLAAMFVPHARLATHAVRNACAVQMGCAQCRVAQHTRRATQAAGEAQLRVCLWPQCCGAMSPRLCVIRDASLRRYGAAAPRHDDATRAR